MNVRRHLCSLCVAAAICLGLSAAAVAEADFPTKELNFVHWNDPGSSADIYVRRLNMIAEKYLKKPIRIVSKPGGNTAIAASYVLNAPADGYTLMHFSAGLSGFMNTPGYPAKPTDFDYLVNAQTIAFMFVIDADLPAKNFAEFVDYARKNDGKLTITGSRVGSMHHQNLFAMAKELGLNLQYLPAAGGSEAMKNLLGKHVQGLVYDPQSMLPYIKQGLIRPIVVFSTKRDPSIPEAPTTAEVGLKMQPIPQVRGVMAKKGIPPEVRKIIVDAYQAALADPDWQEYLKSTNSITDNLTPEEMETRFLQEVTNAKEYLREIGIGK